MEFHDSITLSQDEAFELSFLLAFAHPFLDRDHQESNLQLRKAILFRLKKES